MLLYLFATAYFLGGVFVGLRLTQLSKDIKYVRMSLEEVEEAIDNNTWVVYDNDQHAQ